MSNFFAALDSDDEGTAPAPAVTKKKAPKKVVVEPSKVEKRPIKNDRNTKGGRSSRPPVREGKRTFDRKSGTGRGKEMKKGGGGGHNWGSDQNDAKEAEGPVTEGNEEANTPEGGDPEGEEEKEKEEKEPEPEPEPEPETFSYDEYLAMKARPDSAAFAPLATREADNEFAGRAARPSGRKEEEAFIMKGGKKQPKKKGGGRKEKEKLVLDFKVKNSLGDGRRDSGRRDSGGRGGGRGGGGRGDGRGGRGGGGRGDGRGGRGGGGRGDRGGRFGGGGRGGESGGRGRSGGGSSSKELDTTDSSAFPSL